MENGQAQFQNVEVSESLFVLFSAFKTCICNYSMVIYYYLSIHLTALILAVLCDTNFNLKNGKFHLDFKDNVPDYKMKFTCNSGYNDRQSFYDEYTCTDGQWSPTPDSAQCYGKCLPYLVCTGAQTSFYKKNVIS